MALTLISDLPATVVGVHAHAKVTAEDCRNVLIPAVHTAQTAASDGKIRVLIVLAPQFPNVTAGAVWEDVKLGVGRRGRFQRIAVVSDAAWLRRTIRALGWAIPAEIRIFPFGTLTDARGWVISLSPTPLSGTRRFLGDVIGAFLVLNEARHRATGALFGVSRDWRANLMTVFMIASSVDAVQRVKAAPRAQVRKVRSSPTFVGDSMIGAAVLGEAINRVGTRQAKATASAAGLILLALAISSTRPTVERSLRAIRATVRGVIVETRKIEDTIRHYGAEIRHGSREDDLDGSPGSVEHTASQHASPE